MPGLWSASPGCHSCCSTATCNGTQGVSGILIRGKEDDTPHTSGAALGVVLLAVGIAVVGYIVVKRREAAPTVELERSLGDETQM